jgi:hypothetical protein
MTNQDILPKDPTAALRKMTEITRDLAEKMNTETSSLAMNDATGALMAEQPKEDAVARYEQAAGEFQRRSAEFEDEDQALLDALEQAQEDLRKITQGNLDLRDKLSAYVEK